MRSKVQNCGSKGQLLDFLWVMEDLRNLAFFTIPFIDSTDFDRFIALMNY